MLSHSPARGYVSCELLRSGLSGTFPLWLLAPLPSPQPCSSLLPPSVPSLLLGGLDMALRGFSGFPEQFNQTSSSTGRKQGRGGGERSGSLPGLGRVPTSPGLCSGSLPPIHSSVHSTAIYWASAVIAGHKAVTETNKHPCAHGPIDPRGEDDEQNQKLRLQSRRWGYAPRSRFEMVRPGRVVALLSGDLKVARREPPEYACTLFHII